MRAWKVLPMLSLLARAAPAHGTVLDANFVETATPIDGFGFSSAAWAPDGSDRLFMTTKGGVTHILTAGALLPEPFMALSEIYTGGECGLLGIAFDPNFGQNGYVYFFVTVSSTETRIIRYRAIGNVGVEPTVIVSGLPSSATMHAGGAIAFGPDGKLYWGVGDLGARVGGDDDLASGASKVGRVNRDGSVPLDNPFYDGAGPNDDRIWARGFRNPYSMTFRPETGALWLDVVGALQEQVFVVGPGDHGGWSTYEYFQPADFLAPVITYYTNINWDFGLFADGAVRSGGVATFTVGTRHWLHRGEHISVRGVTDPSFDGEWYVIDTPSETSFRVEQPGPDAMSGSGTASTQLYGGCLTGGVFNDSTAPGVAYRGNYFFGDWNTGNLMRARLSGDAVTSVDLWAEGLGGVVDTSIGPDGDLYVTTYGHPSQYRYRFRTTTQSIVVSRSNVWMLEDGVAAFNVRLAIAPASAVEVEVAPVTASSPLTITRGATLAFDPNDWSTPQTVALRSERDENRVDDVVELAVTALDLPEESVFVRITDEHEPIEPPAGGAGGETGDGGDAGDGGAGADMGGTAGVSMGGRAAAGGTGASAGTSSEGGEGGVADETGGTRGVAEENDSGCGCAMNKNSGSGAALLVLSLVLLRRRGRTSQTTEVQV